MKPHFFSSGQRYQGHNKTFKGGAVRDTRTAHPFFFSECQLPKTLFPNFLHLPYLPSVSPAGVSPHSGLCKPAHDAHGSCSPHAAAPPQLDRQKLLPCPKFLKPAGTGDIYRLLKHRGFRLPQPWVSPPFHTHLLNLCVCAFNSLFVGLFACF